MLTNLKRELEQELSSLPALGPNKRLHLIRDVLDLFDKYANRNAIMWQNRQTYYDGVVVLWQQTIDLLKFTEAHCTTYDQIKKSELFFLDWELLISIHKFHYNHIPMSHFKGAHLFDQPLGKLQAKLEHYSTVNDYSRLYREARALHELENFYKSYDRI